jgi:hypothetical protein
VETAGEVVEAAVEPVADAVGVVVDPILNLADDALAAFEGARTKPRRSPRRAEKDKYQPYPMEHYPRHKALAALSKVIDERKARGSPRRKVVEEVVTEPILNLSGTKPRRSPRRAVVEEVVEPVAEVVMERRSTRTRRSPERLTMGGGKA